MTAVTPFPVQSFRIATYHCRLGCHIKDVSLSPLSQPPLSASLFAFSLSLLSRLLLCRLNLSLMPFYCVSLLRPLLQLHILAAAAVS